MRRALPRWLTVLTAAVVVMNVFVFGLFSLVHPELPWPTLGPDAAVAVEFFAARHIAFGVVLFHGLRERNLVILRACYTIFFVIALLDFGLLAVHGYSIPVLVRFVGELPRPVSLLLSLGLFVVPMGLSMAWLRRHP